MLPQRFCVGAQHAAPHLGTQPKRTLTLELPGDARPLGRS